MAQASESKGKQVAVKIEATPEHTSSVNGAPTSEQIARLAYSYAEAREFQNGSPDEDWVRAEAELKRSQREVTK